MKLICWIRGHDWTPIADDGMVLFTPGIPFPHPSRRYRVDALGPHRACKRCGTVKLSSLPLCTATGTYRDGVGQTTCDRPAGHAGMHSNPDDRVHSRSGLWSDS